MSNFSTRLEIEGWRVGYDQTRQSIELEFVTAGGQSFVFAMSEEAANGLAQDLSRKAHTLDYLKSGGELVQGRG